MLSFPNEDRIMEAARERWEGIEIPDFGEHRHGCPCHDMTEEEYDEDDGESCRCEDIAHEEAEDARVDAMLSRMEDY